MTVCASGCGLMIYARCGGHTWRTRKPLNFRDDRRPEQTEKEIMNSNLIINTGALPGCPPLAHAARCRSCQCAKVGGCQYPVGRCISNSKVAPVAAKSKPALPDVEYSELKHCPVSRAERSAEILYPYQKYLPAGTHDLWLTLLNTDREAALASLIQLAR
jgi:hypothetical protein